MVKEVHFSSALADELALHLKQCEASIDRNSYERRISQLHDWDHYLVSNNYQQGDPIDEKLVNEWIEKHLDLAGRTIMTYVNAVRQFLIFYSQVSGRNVYVPPSYKFDDNYVPYLFTDEEMDRIYNKLDNYQKGRSNIAPFIEIELPLVVRMLDANGFRLNELITTRMQNVDLEAGVLRMINTKNSRQRLVPLSLETTGQLQAYCKRMGLKEGTDQCLFPRSTPYEPLKRQGVGSIFRSVLEDVGIRKKSSHNYQRGPCIHCLRHRFVLRSIKQLLNQGISIDDAIPYLSTYLGHDSLYETEKYMKFSADLFPEELDKFANASELLFPEEKYWDDWM